MAQFAAQALIEQLATSLDEHAREEIQKEVNEAQAELAGHAEVVATAERISQRLIAIAGEQYAVPLTLGLAPTRVDALLRGLRLLIDNGVRGVPDASLGTANLIFLALKSLELDRLVTDGERDHTFFAVEEPEAHLHPHVQRLVYRYFLGATENDDEAESPLTTILTTHSPHITSVTPMRSIVLLRHDAEEDATVAVSTATVPLTERDEADLQRYIDVTRGEIFFARRRDLGRRRCRAISHSRLRRCSRHPARYAGNHCLLRRRHELHALCEAARAARAEYRRMSSLRIVTRRVTGRRLCVVV